MRYSWGFKGIPELADLPKEDQCRILDLASKKARGRWQSWSLLLIAYAIPFTLSALTLVFVLADSTPDPPTEDMAIIGGFFLVGTIFVIMYSAGIAYCILHTRVVKRYARQIRQTNYWETKNRLDAKPRLMSRLLLMRKWLIPEFAALSQEQRLRTFYRARVQAVGDWRFWVYVTVGLLFLVAIIMLGALVGAVLAVALTGGSQQPNPTPDPLLAILMLVFMIGGMTAGAVIVMPFVVCFAVLVQRQYLREVSQAASRQGTEMRVSS